MLYVSETSVQKALDQAGVTAAIQEAFIALAKGEAFNFPIVRERLNYADAIFGFKAGFDRRAPTLSVKAGGLWPGNRAKGLANHQSTILLFDADTGGPHALVCGTYLTALRTAAASALSIRALARAEAQTLGILGAGGQALHQIRAALTERPFGRLLISDSVPENAEALRQSLKDTGLATACVTPETLARDSDVLITVTPSFEPIIEADWVQPGTHIACMGADTVGKQEVDATLMTRATLFCDQPDQAAQLGEIQHAIQRGMVTLDQVTTLGDVLRGAHTGRQSADEITLFDSTGMGLQDLAAARFALEEAVAQGLAVALDE